MKKLIMILLCVLMMPFLSGCTEQGTTGNPKLPQNTASLSSQGIQTQPETSIPQKEIKVTVDLPHGWTPVEGSQLPAHYIKDGSAVFMVMKQGYTGDTIDAVTEKAKAANENAYKNVKYEGETQSVKVDGKDARKFVCTYDFSGLKMKSMFVYFFYGSDTYTIAFTNFPDSYEALSDDYADILARIKFE